MFSNQDKSIVPEGPKQFTGLENVISFSNLNFKYAAGVEIIRDVSFLLEKGTTVALVGESGAGKSTLMSLLLRLYDCPPKTIYIDEVDIRDYSIDSLYENISVVTQEPILFNDTLRKNLVYGERSQYSDLDLLDVMKRVHLDSLVDRLPQGFDTLVGERGVKLSGGEKQRLAIARVLLKKAKIVLMDEPTSSLDSQTELIVQNYSKEFFVDKTVIVVAHR
ncbi:UNVERIFIED_CONTAM: hypothetical protein GTU68_030796, partial [Idotea baltica]|nr:hypothetical protein [Idotea baltica]